MCVGKNVLGFSRIIEVMIFLKIVEVDSMFI